VVRHGGHPSTGVTRRECGPKGVEVIGATENIL
jgi:hypothetical protein